MKRFILAAAALLPLFFSSCEDTQEGCEPGGSTPNVILYQYSADSEYDADSYTKIRLAVTSATSEVYLLSESEEDYKAHFSGDKYAYADYVVDNGEKITVDGNLNIDRHVLAAGTIYVTAVAVSGSSKAISGTATFTGRTFSVVEGTEGYIYSDFAGGASNAKLYVCDQNPFLYRIKGICHSYFAEEESQTFDMELTVLTDANGEAVTSGDYTFLRITTGATPYSYGSYGTINYRDVATWQSDESYATSSLGCYMTADNEIVLVVSYYVSAGNLAYKMETFGYAGE